MGLSWSSPSSVSGSVLELWPWLQAVSYTHLDVYKRQAKEAVERATMFNDPVDLPPGRYDTIFLEYALSDLIRFLGYVAFGAAAKQRGTSFMATSMGQKAMGDNITIWDDGLDPVSYTHLDVYKRQT